MKKGPQINASKNIRKGLSDYGGLCEKKPTGFPVMTNSSKNIGKGLSDCGGLCEH